MSDARVDAERLAMLLEGRMPPAERERLLVELAADPDAAADLAAAAAALGETGATRAPGVAAPPAASLPRGGAAREDRPMPSAWRRYAPLIAAASFVVAAVLGTAIWRATRVSSLEGTFATVAGLRTDALPDDWSDPPWARTRGAGTDTAVPALSAMLGARMAELEVARRQAPDRVPALTGSVSAIVRQIPGSGPALARWEVAASASDGEGLEEARGELEQLVDPVRYEAGATLEGIRLALLAGDDETLRSLSGRLTNLARSTGLPAAFVTDAARLVAMLQAEATTARNREERLRAVDEAFRAAY